MIGRTQPDNLSDCALSLRQADEQSVTTFYFDNKRDALWAGLQLRWTHAQQITICQVTSVEDFGLPLHNLTPVMTLTYAGWIRSRPSCPLVVESLVG